MDTSALRDTFLRDISRLYEEGGDGNYLVVSAPPAPYYVQVAARRGDPRGRLEAISNAFLDESDALDEPGLARLVEFGLSPVEARENHTLSFDISTTAGRAVAAEVALLLLVDVYRVDPSAVSFDLSLNERWRLANPRLRAARESGDRKRLLTELASAVVLMPHVSGQGLDGVHRTPEGEAVFFTEEQSIAPYVKAVGISPEGSVAPCAELLEWLGRQPVIFDPRTEHALKLTGDEVLQVLAIAGRA